MALLCMRTKVTAKIVLSALYHINMAEARSRARTIEHCPAAAENVRPTNDIASCIFPLGKNAKTRSKKGYLYCSKRAARMYGK